MISYDHFQIFSSVGVEIRHRQHGKFPVKASLHMPASWHSHCQHVSRLESCRAAFFLVLSYENSCFQNGNLSAKGLQLISSQYTWPPSPPNVFSPRKKLPIPMVNRELFYTSFSAAVSLPSRRRHRVVRPMPSCRAATEWLFLHFFKTARIYCDSASSMASFSGRFVFSVSVAEPDSVSRYCAKTVFKYCWTLSFFPTVCSRAILVQAVQFPDIAAPAVILQIIAPLIDQTLEKLRVLRNTHRG